MRPADVRSGDRVRFKIGRHPVRTGLVIQVGPDHVLVQVDRAHTNAPKYAEILEVECSHRNKTPHATWDRPGHWRWTCADCYADLPEEKKS